MYANYLLALALLSAPEDSPLPVVDRAQFEAVRPAVRHLALAWEILDPREVRHVLARSDDFAADINLLRRRRAELADAPYLYDCYRFPDREAVSALLEFNRAYRQHLGFRQPLELSHWWELRAAVQETEDLYRIWDTIRDARCEFYYVTVRRQALQRLREMLGDDAYYNCELPPCVPIWRFQSID